MQEFDRPAGTTMEDESIRGLVLKMMNDMETFKQNVLKEIRVMKTEIRDMPSKVVEKLKEEGLVMKAQEEPSSAAQASAGEPIVSLDLDQAHPVTDPNVCDESLLKALEDSRLPQSGEFVLSKRIIEARPEPCKLIVPYQRPPVEELPLVPIPDVSKFRPSKAKKVVMSRFTPDGQPIMTEAERRSIEKIYKREIRIFSKSAIADPIIVDKSFLPDSKGKRVVDSDDVCLSSSLSLSSEIVSVEELLDKVNEGQIITFACREPELNVKLCESSTSYFHPTDMYYVEDDLNVLYSSEVLRFVDSYDFVSSSKTIYIEDVDREAEKENVKAIKRAKNEQILENKIAFAQRLESDPEFASCLDRLIKYRGGKEDDLYRLHPDQIVKACIDKDYEKLSSLIKFSCERQSKEDDIKDLCFDHTSMKVSSLRTFLKKHGFSNFELK